MWKAITYVSSGITLVAFIVAVAAWIYRAKILERERLIRQAPDAKRSALIERTLEFFSIDTSELTREQKYNLALQQIHQRASRFRVTASLVITIACLAASVSIFALWREPTALPNASSLNPSPTQLPAQSNLSIQSPTIIPSPTQSTITPISRPTPSPILPPLHEIYRKAKDYDKGIKVTSAGNDYGTDVIMNEQPFDVGGSTVEYVIKSERESDYRLLVEYASKNSRPVSIYVNDELVNANGLADITGGWTPEHQKFKPQGIFHLKAGNNILKFHTDGFLPHIRTIKLEPKS